MLHSTLDADDAATRGMSDSPYAASSSSLGRWAHGPIICGQPDKWTARQTDSQIDSEKQRQRRGDKRTAGLNKGGLGAVLAYARQYWRVGETCLRRETGFLFSVRRVHDLHVAVACGADETGYKLYG